MYNLQRGRSQRFSNLNDKIESAAQDALKIRVLAMCETIKSNMGDSAYVEWIVAAPDDNTAFTEYASAKYAELTAPEAARQDAQDEADRRDEIGYARTGF